MSFSDKVGTKLVKADSKKNAAEKKPDELQLIEQKILQFCVKPRVSSQVIQLFPARGYNILAIMESLKRKGSLILAANKYVTDVEHRGFDVSMQLMASKKNASPTEKLWDVSDRSDRRILLGRTNILPEYTREYISESWNNLPIWLRGSIEKTSKVASTLPTDESLWKESIKTKLADLQQKNIAFQNSTEAVDYMVGEAGTLTEDQKKYTATVYEELLGKKAEVKKADEEKDPNRFMYSWSIMGPSNRADYLTSIGITEKIYKLKRTKWENLPEEVKSLLEEKFLEEESIEASRKKAENDFEIIDYEPFERMFNWTVKYKNITYLVTKYLDPDIQFEVTDIQGNAVPIEIEDEILELIEETKTSSKKKADAYVYEFLVPVMAKELIDENEINDVGIERWLTERGADDIVDDIHAMAEEVEGEDFDEAFERWMKRNDVNWYTFLQRFSDRVTLEDLSEDVWETLQADFNESELEKYVREDLEGKVTSIRATQPGSGGFVVEVKTTTDLDEKEVESLIDYLEGQFSDGWGEGFEQQEIKSDDKTWYVHTWWSKSEKGWRPYPGVTLMQQSLTDLEEVKE